MHCTHSPLYLARIIHEITRSFRKPGALIPFVRSEFRSVGNTVKAMLLEHNLYITDWQDARDVPAALGSFDLDDFVTEIIECIRWIGHEVHVIAVCQPAVAAVAATARMATMDDDCTPASLTLMGGPLDTRKNPNAINKLAESKSLDWFKNNVIERVPWPNAGFWRRFYPGFIQLSGFMQVNLNRHMEAHRNVFKDLIKGDSALNSTTSFTINTWPYGLVC